MEYSQQKSADARARSAQKMSTEMRARTEGEASARWLLRLRRILFKLGEDDVLAKVDLSLNGRGAERKWALR